MSLSATIDKPLPKVKQGRPSVAGQVDEPVEQPVVDPLFGAFPELAAITEEDLAWVKQQWNQHFERQLPIL